MTKFGLFCVGLCVAAVLSACGESGTTAGPATDTTTASAPSAPADATISIADFSYGDPVTVAPSALITIINGDSVEHSVTSRTPGLFDVHVDANQQQTLTAPAEPGEYPFYCVYHPSMTGTLIVK